MIGVKRRLKLWGLLFRSMILRSQNGAQGRPAIQALLDPGDIADSAYVSDSAVLQGEGDLRGRFSVGAMSCFGGVATLETPVARISIGDRCSVDAQIASAKEVCIGSDVLVASGVMIWDHDAHSLNWRERQNDVSIHHRKCVGSQGDNLPQKDWTVVSKAPVLIRDKVWIGARVIILKGVTIGEGAVVGAGSVVTHSVESWTLVVGNPAKRIRDLDR